MKIGNKKILIVGGGIGGMASAIVLRQKGVTVELIEKNKIKNSALGVGIILQGNAMRALGQMGILDQCLKAGRGFNKFIFHDANGSNEQELPGHLIAGPDYPPMMATTRASLSDILTDAAINSGASIRYGLTVQEISQDNDGVNITFSDKTSDRYDAIIGADGVRSTLRSMIFGDHIQPIYSGQSVWRYSNLPRPSHIDEILLYSGPDGTAGFVPLSKDIMYFLYTDASPSLPDPDNLLQDLKEKLSPFRNLVAEYRDTHLNNPENIVYRKFETIDLPAPWYKNRVILIGDAAHASTAHLGQGGALALEDAVVIGEEIGKNASINDAFKSFMERRYERCKFIKEASEQICRWEIEKTPDADPIGLTQRAFDLIKQPI